MSVIYLAEIKQLIELQKVDDERYATKQVLTNAPEEIAQLSKKFEAISRRRDHILDKISHLNEQTKRLMSEITDDSARIKKSKTKLMQAENTREYQAMIREVDNMEKSSTTREEEKSALDDELRNQNVLLAEIDKDYSALKSELEVKQSGLKQRIAETEAVLKELDAKRAATSKEISEPVFLRYEFIRERLDHPVIVAVKDGVCTGCHMAVPPQVFIELQRGQQIMSCPNCQRLIFWDRHFDEEEDFPNQANSPKPVQEVQEEGFEEGEDDVEEKAVKSRKSRKKERDEAFEEERDEAFESAESEEEKAEED